MGFNMAELSVQMDLTNFVVAKIFPKYHQRGYIRVHSTAEQKADSGVAYWP
jgi:hypothetical protein